MPVKQMMRPRQPFSGTLYEDGMVDEPVLNKDGGKVYNEDGSLKTKQVKGKVAIPVTLNPTDIFPEDHEYVQTWPYHFQAVG
jgi:hypothetical protein